MIHLVVSIKVKEGKLNDFVRLFNETALSVRKEKGCVEYFAAVDAETGMPNQARDVNRVVILEKWENLDALKAHGSTPHMKVYLKAQGRPRESRP